MCERHSTFKARIGSHGSPYPSNPRIPTRPSVSHTTATKRMNATHLRHLPLAPLPVRIDDLDVDVVIRLVCRLGVAPLVLAREQRADDEHQRGAHDVADADDEPGDMVTKVHKGKLLSTTKN